MDRKKIIDEFIRKAGWWFAWDFKKHAMEDEGYIVNTKQDEKTCFLGDSRVAGGDWSKIKSRLVDNKGVGGTMFSGWTQYGAMQYLVTKNYEEVIIGLGGNDLAVGNSDQKILGDLQKIIFILKKYTYSKIYVHCIIPIWRHGKADNKDVIRVNELMKKLCDANKIDFIDFEKEFTFDGRINPEYLNLSEVPAILWNKMCPVHLNEMGYALWYDLLNCYFKGK